MVIEKSINSISRLPSTRDIKIVLLNLDKQTINGDGMGFKDGEEQRIFRRFYKGTGGNTGLGLSIAMAIAQNHGGAITAWNASTNGAVIEVTLSI
ncbi:MAG: hypothetical protein KAH14_06240 [Clostridiales bacterium]|nr:hypothetical protein [Clostridiales bacterium]